MATTQFSAFLPSIMIDVLGCPDILVEREIRNSAIDFFRRSQAWRAQLDPISVAANVDTYDIEQYGSAVEKIIDVFYTGIQLTPKTYGEINAQRKLAIATALGITSDSVLPSVKFYAQQNPSQIVLYGMPDASYVDGLLIDAVLVPTRTSTGMDSVIADRYWDAIVHGAKHRLMIVPGKPWTDANLAAWHKTQMDNLVDSAGIEAVRGFNNAPIRTKTYFR